MALSSKLVRLLKRNMREVPVPEEYAKLRERLLQIQPSRRAPKIKESPENVRRVGFSVDEEE